jgi:flagellar hook protein FlgE
MVAYSMFSPAVSAMNAQSLAFQNISDNIANSTTTGYKAGQVRFQEMVASKSKGSTFSNFLGTQANQQIFRDKEGVIYGTQRRLDAALSGSGFFITSPSLTPSDDTLELTDAGIFGESVVSNGGAEEVYLTDLKGNYLMGWPYDVATETYSVDTTSTAGLQPIRIDPEGNVYDAVATTEGGLKVNLPGTAATGESYSFDLPVYDGTGDDDGFSDEQQLIATFVKNAAANTWDMTISGTGGTVATPAVQPVAVTFDASGNLTTVNGVANTPLDISITWADSGATNTMTLDLSGTTQYGGSVTQESITSNGSVQGQLSSVTLGKDGNVIGNFTNGLQRPIGRIAVGDVVEPNRLVRTGDTHFKLGANSGTLQLVDLANTSRVTFSANSLEQSTTDLALEFSTMIMTQRAYSSAATSLKTVDEMVRTATELKS